MTLKLASNRCTAIDGERDCGRGPFVVVGLTGWIRTTASNIAREDERLRRLALGLGDEQWPSYLRRIIPLHRSVSA